MCRSNACGCGRSSPLPAAAIITAVAVVGVSAAAAVIESIAVAILAIMGVLAAAGVACLVWKVRTGGTLYKPMTAALPAPTRPRAVGAGRPAAIEAPRSVPGVVLDPAEAETIRR